MTDAPDGTTPQATIIHPGYCDLASCDGVDAEGEGLHRSALEVIEFPWPIPIKFGLRLSGLHSEDTVECELSVEDMMNVRLRPSEIMSVESTLEPGALDHLIERFKYYADQARKYSRTGGPAKYGDGRTGDEVLREIVGVVRSVTHLSICRANFPVPYPGGLEFDPQHPTILLDCSHTDDELTTVLCDELREVRRAHTEYENECAAELSHPDWCDLDGVCRYVVDTGEIEHGSGPLTTVPGNLADQQMVMGKVRADVVRDGHVEVGDELFELYWEEKLEDGSWVRVADRTQYLTHSEMERMSTSMTALLAGGGGAPAIPNQQS